jgi:hypothetical protein
MKKIGKVNAERQLLNGITLIIEQSRHYVANTSNSTLTMLYWKIGQRINYDRLKSTHAEHGKPIIVSQAHQLTNQYDRGFDEKSIRRMMQFATNFPNEKIVVSLMRQLSWTYIIALIPLKNKLQREFDAET